MPDASFLLDHFGFSSITELNEKLFVAAILESFERLSKRKDLAALSEPQIRNRLAADLENCNELLRPYFDGKILNLAKENTVVEVESEETKRTDIEFFISWIGRFVVECKKQRSFSSDYITEGVHRFRDEKYAKEDDEAGMLAFIVKGDVPKIINKTRAMVHADPSFVHSVAGSDLCFKHPHSFHSAHKRANTRTIFIHHLFLDFTRR